MNLKHNLAISTKMQVQVVHPDGTVLQSDWVSNTLMDKGIEHLLGVPTDANLRVQPIVKYLTLGTGTAPTDTSKIALDSYIGYLADPEQLPPVRVIEQGVQVITQRLEYGTDTTTFAGDISELGLMVTNDVNNLNDSNLSYLFNRVLLPEALTVQQGSYLKVVVDLMVNMPASTEQVLTVRRDDGSVVSTHTATTVPATGLFPDNPLDIRWCYIETLRFMSVVDDRGIPQTFTTNATSQTPDLTNNCIEATYTLDHTDLASALEKVHVVITGLVLWVTTFSPPVPKSDLIRLSGAFKLHIS